MKGQLFFAIMTAAAAGCAAASNARADEAAARVVVSLSPGHAPAGLVRLSVAGAAGRYDRLTAATAGAALKLSAKIEPGGNAARKIVQSAVAIKSEAGGVARQIATIAQGRLTDAIDDARTFDLPVAADSDIALKAIAACNSLKTETRAALRTTAIDVPILWRVTTGRFTFKWTNYDRVAPSADILTNPDFYGERETAEAETVASIGVDCAPLPATGLVAKGKSAAVAKVEPANFATATPAMTTEPDAPVRISNDKPQCLGGMLRPIGLAATDGFGCLCPGNTARVETGDNAFACQRRLAR